MSRSSQHGRTSSVSASRARFEDAFRVYHEVEDVGKTVKASKRRARWTFSFGAQGQEHEVILVHSVMSGKKVVTYDGRTVHQAEEMSRAFSHSWHDGDHVLRVDITDLVEYGTGRGGDRMYELTLDGVPFASLPIKPVTLPPRPGFARGSVSGSGASGRPSLSDTQQRPHQRRASGGGGSPGGSGWAGDEGEGQDDFDPRGSSSGKPRAVMRQQQQPSSSSPSNAADLLGAGTDNGFLGGGSSAAPAPVSAPAAAVGGFDPFTASGAAPSLPLQHQHYHHQQQPQQPPPDPKKLADEFGALSFAGPSPTTTTLFPTAPLLPQKPGNAHNGHGTALVPLPDMSTFKQPPGAGLPSPGEENGTMSTALIPAGDAQNPEVARLTAALVNLNNLERESDGRSPPVSPSRGGRRGGSVYYSRSVYTDHRSLAEMKASQSHKPQDPQAKPIFIERAIPPVAMVSPVPPGPRTMMMMQQAPPPYGMGMGMAPGQGQAAFYGQHPSPGGMQPPPMMMMGAGGGGMGMMMPPPPAQQPVGMGMGMPQPPMMPHQQPARPMMKGGGMGGMMAPPPLPPQPMMMGGMGPRPGQQQQQPMPMQAMQQPQQGMIPPPRGPPDTDPFRAFGL